MFPDQEDPSKKFSPRALNQLGTIFPSQERHQSNLTSLKRIKQIKQEMASVMFLTLTQSFVLSNISPLQESLLPQLPSSFKPYLSYLFHSVPHLRFFSAWGGRQCQCMAHNYGEIKSVCCFHYLTSWLEVLHFDNQFRYPYDDNVKIPSSAMDTCHKKNPGILEQRCCILTSGLKFTGKSIRCLSFIFVHSPHLSCLVLHMTVEGSSQCSLPNRCRCTLLATSVFSSPEVLPLSAAPGSSLFSQIKKPLTIQIWQLMTQSSTSFFTTQKWNLVKHC